MLKFNQPFSNIGDYLSNLDISRYYYMMSLTTSGFSYAFLRSSKFNETVGSLAVSVSLAFSGKLMETPADRPSRSAEVHQ